VSYCTKADIEQRFGAANITSWSNINNEDSTEDITARVASAIAFAEAEINDRLRGGVYGIPLTLTNPSDDEGANNTPPMIQEICINLAAVRLYEARGVEDFDEKTGKPFHKLTWCRTDAAEKLKEIRVGVIRLDAVRVATNVPRAASDLRHDR
jgi:phage gp36-like protein